MNRPVLRLLVLLIHSCQSARILGIVGTASYSHQVPFQPLWRELSLRGHQVVVLTTDPVKDPSLTNLTEVDLHGSYEIWNKMDIMDLSNMLASLEQLVKLGVEMQDWQLSHPEVQKLIRDPVQRFDVLLLEPFSPAMNAFAKRFDCPLIHLFSLDSSIHAYHLVGNPAHPVLNPDFMLPLAGKLNFFERLASTGSMLFTEYLMRYKTYPSSQELVYKHFGADYPLVHDISRNSSLLFINTDNVFHPVRPLLPSVIQIGGGTHMKPLKPLPKNLQQELNKAKQGAIYLSFGSNVKSKDLPEEKRKVIMGVLAELPYKVFWKFELEDLPDKPNNVIISQWFPQQDVLRHPNIKLFITQGGLQSLEEAVYSGVSIVAIPFIADQFANVKRMTEKGIGVALEFKTLTRESFKAAILEAINNPMYQSKVKELAELAQDQPMKGIDKAIWWTEYVIRHKGAEHLRSPGRDLPLYQYFLLDVIAFCLFLLFVALYVLYILIRLSFKFIKYLVSKPKIKSE